VNTETESSRQRSGLGPVRPRASSRFGASDFLGPAHSPPRPSDDLGAPVSSEIVDGVQGWNLPAIDSASGTGNRKMGLPADPKHEGTTGSAPASGTVLADGLILTAGRTCFPRFNSPEGIPSSQSRAQTGRRPQYRPRTTFLWRTSTKLEFPEGAPIDEARRQGHPARARRLQCGDPTAGSAVRSASRLPLQELRRWLQRRCCKRCFPDNNGSPGDGATHVALCSFRT